ncbi:MAG: peptide-methionine (S)-S-oxide reductase MsrA [Candidatus Pacebacteria bacterium]|jgi:peptide-methionine (S)-S-oxide reductase|nr:peptide-methionine (S)-S-oxide reductase MsrA [Candidatus Paceibacterota bacterium]
MENVKKSEVVVFGAGCFWCAEAIFSRLKGVIAAIPGYAGGKAEYPTYEKVCGGNTGHAEVVRVEYDPEIINFDGLLTVFFAIHDPAAVDRQGNDIGPQYRSAIFYTTGAQKTAADNFIKEWSESGRFRAVTEIKPLEKFYPAEDCHRDYYAKNKNAPYCQVIINPKLDKFKKRFTSLLKP